MALFGFVRDTWLVLGRLVRYTIRMPIWLLMAVVQPIIWVVAFGAIFTVVAKIPGFGSESYAQFLAPGVAIMTAVFGSAHSGLSFLADIDRGVLDRMLVTPVSRGALVAGRVSHAGLQVIIQALIILFVSWLRGAHSHGGIVGLAIVCLAASFLGAAVAALSSGLALWMRRQETVIAVINFLLLPMMFLSSMLMASNLLPGWVRAIARLNPVNWAVAAARGAYEGNALATTLPPLVGIWLFATACIALATLAFRNYRKSI